TIGDFFLVLSEMGFTEEQIQAAVQTGHLSVPEAAELLQGQSPRHRLTQQPSRPAETAFSAFNPPSRIKQDKSDFEEQQRQRVAQEAREQRKQKKQERELVLKRIAEDRKTLQVKNQTAPVSEAPLSTNEGQKLGGKIQTSVENCILMIRLPSGESMRERFPADASLRSVVEHISGRHPSLTSFSLLQGFPRKRFGEAELACSLHSLGLTPSAALCIQTTPPETPQEPPSSVNPPAAEQQIFAFAEPSPPQIPDQDRLPDQDRHPDPAVPPLLPNQLWEEAVNYAGIPDMGHLLSGPSHSWGRGQRLVPGDAEEAAEVEAVVQEGERWPRLPFFQENRVHGGFEPRHQWPDQGNRLLEQAVDGPVAPVAAGQAAVERLQRAAQQNDAHVCQGQPSPPKRAFKTPSVQSLCALAARAAVSVMTPSMQYSSSLAGLTPDLAELLLEHMSRERLLRPRTLELFFGCPLRRFVLNCYPYSTNELLRQLRAFTALKHLSLINSPLITSGLSILPSLVKLQYLNLASCSKLTDACLQHITLKSLYFLSLDQTKVTDSGMVLYLQSAPSCLSQLSLNQTTVTEVTLEALTSFVPQLRVLSIKQTKVSQVTALSQMCNLQTLSLDGTGVTETSLEHLRNHPSLSSLSLTGIHAVDGNHTLQIISLKLTHLTLPGRHCVTDSGMSALSRLTLLCELDLTDYTHVTDQGVRHLCTLTLRKLSLSNTQVSDAGLPFLQGLQELQDLCLDRTTVTSQGVADLIVHLPLLQVLGLASTHVGDSVVRKGLIRCNQLVKINLSRTRITDQLKVLKRMNLAQVNLDGTGVTLSGIANLLSLTNINCIRASNTRVIPPDEVS
uniref:UBX domain-containing protein n=1 Tax=Periophthalmus magnuspinnatus TaxID=409849 RepID=A0A3B4AJ77_9GOBI